MGVGSRRVEVGVMGVEVEVMGVGGVRIMTPTPSIRPPPFSNLPTPTPLHTFRVKSLALSLFAPNRPRQIVIYPFGLVGLHFGDGLQASQALSTFFNNLTDIHN